MDNVDAARRYVYGQCVWFGNRYSRVEHLGQNFIRKLFCHMLVWPTHMIDHYRKENHFLLSKILLMRFNIQLSGQETISKVLSLSHLMNFRAYMKTQVLSLKSKKR